MKPNPLPPNILKLLPPPGIDDLSPDILNQSSPKELKDCLDLVPREKTKVMVETLVGMAGQMAAKMTTEAWHCRLRKSIRDALLAGTLPTMQVIAAAERCRAVDLALRKILVEELDLPGDVASTTALRAYLQRALLRDVTRNSSGHPEDYMLRDIGIAILMTLSMVRWPYLRKSVSHASKKPSHSKLVAAALNRCGVTNITHHQVLKIFDSHDLIVGRLAALIAA